MIFGHIRLVEDRNPGAGAWNMGVDEMLLDGVKMPTLRVYRWSERTTTFGYFEKLAKARMWHPAGSLMRRWTGGGLVDHGADWTYSLIVPAADKLTQRGRGESYVVIHEVLRHFLEVSCGISVSLASGSGCEGEGCFASPVRGDLLVEGRKVAGAAQRRTRRGLLHQGSVQVEVPEGVAPMHLARCLAETVADLPLTDEELGRAAELVSSRYGTQEWLERF